MATKRKHNADSINVKYDAINNRDKRPFKHADVAAMYGVPPSALSTWFKKQVSRHQGCVQL